MLYIVGGYLIDREAAKRWAVRCIKGLVLEDDTFLEYHINRWQKGLNGTMNAFPIELDGEKTFFTLYTKLDKNATRESFTPFTEGAMSIKAKEVIFDEQEFRDLAEFRTIVNPNLSDFEVQLAYSNMSSERRNRYGGYGEENCG